ncbi:MAG: hypothetical protein DHS20C18_56100 [Saprospiraceae bacterium]|nr:MAG: hypothetical protein DHS20C18_56100 [Saprospiraceae bacterium]
MEFINKISLFALLFGVLTACQSDPKENIDPNSPMLELLSPATTGINFSNDIEETPEFNHFIWEEIYNGGGVSVGDINNDGLPDIFFTGNRVTDKLYLNKGNFKFEDITVKAGIMLDRGWSFGTTMADVNGDGYLDIYVCRSGLSLEPDDRRNLLYLNNGDLTFKEVAKAYGVDNGGVSMQATFLDYDKDGDLDLYLVNQPLNKRYIPRYDVKPDPLDPNYSDRLFRLDGDKYTDVSVEAGINNYAYGLNVVAADIDDDGWVDIYVSCDYEDPDFFYHNNGDGTFTDMAEKQLKHISFYSMGSDVADYNNDGLKDITVVDMASADHYRSKTNMGSMNIDQFWSYVNTGKHYQYMFNVLQMNNGNGSFSEIGQMAHMSKTDWSWAVLMADIDNDALKDIIVTNGIKKDIRNNDFAENLKREIQKGNTNFDLMKLVNAMPSNPLANFAFRNKGDLTFENATTDWGFDQKGFSNGMAYADFDRDGDLDLIINNLDAPASLYRNVKGRLNNYLRVQLAGEGLNTFALNAKVKIEHGETQQVQELTLTRGYFSSVEPGLHFGIGDAEKVDRVTITWPNGKSTVLENVKANQVLRLNQKDADGDALAVTQPITRFKEIDNRLGVDFQHQENEFDDFKREILLPHKQSQNGPYLAKGDVNGDGLDDFFIGGAAGQSGQLYLNQGEQGFVVAASQPWSADQAQEDMGALLFDADGDGDQDLYVVSGGSEFDKASSMYQDRLYFNDGTGNFTRRADALPGSTSSGQCVIAGDIDGDGDLDLFVGGRTTPGQYPVSPESYLLLNEGGKFKDVTSEIAPELSRVGMVTDALFVDYDQDQDLDLVMVGEWMPVSIFNNDQGVFTNESTEAYVDQLKGWWWSIAAGDFDADGDIDFVVGNLGHNHKFKASNDHPFIVFGSDFDENGSNDVVLAKYSGDKLLPVRGRQCTSEQMPFVAEKFPTYEGFAKATLENIYTPQKLQTAVKYEVTTFSSLLLKNNGAQQFSSSELPLPAQVAPIRSMEVRDLNGDGHLDILAVGNMYQAEVETIRYDASTGLCMLGDGQGNFTVEPVLESGFFTPGDARDLIVIEQPKPTFIVANNNDLLQFFRQ